MDLRIDWDFIAKEEGGRRLHGYVPLDENHKPIGRSGVTIATGIDLGARTVLQLRKFGIPSALMEKLEPYVGWKRDAAVDCLRRKGLTLTLEEARTLEAAIKSFITSTVVNRYNERTSGRKFEELPPPIQTAFMCAAYNLGEYFDIPPRYRALYNAATAQDWKQFARELRKNPSRNPELQGRRDREAALVESCVR